MKKSLLVLALLSGSVFADSTVEVQSVRGDWSLHQVTDNFDYSNDYYISSLDTNLDTELRIGCHEVLEGRMFLQHKYDQPMSISSELMAAPMVVIIKQGSVVTHHQGIKPNVLADVDLSAQLFSEASAGTDITLRSRQQGYVAAQTRIFEYKLSSYGFAQQYQALQSACGGL